MKTPNYPSIEQFKVFVELKDFRPPTKKEYVRYVRKLAEHFQCDPATLTEDQLREYFLFLRQHKHYKHSPMIAYLVLDKQNDKPNFPTRCLEGVL